MPILFCVTFQDLSPPTENALRSATGAEESEREDLKSYLLRRKKGTLWQDVEGVRKNHYTS